MPIPRAEQEKQAVDGHPSPDLAVPGTDFTPRAIPKQQLGSSSKSSDVGGTSAPSTTALMKELSISLSPPAESEDGSYILVLEQRPSKCNRGC